MDSTTERRVSDLDAAGIDHPFISERLGNINIFSPGSSSPKCLLIDNSELKNHKNAKSHRPRPRMTIHPLKYFGSKRFQGWGVSDFKVVHGGGVSIYSVNIQYVTHFHTSTTIEFKHQRFSASQNTRHTKAITRVERARVGFERRPSSLNLL